MCKLCRSTHKIAPALWRGTNVPEIYHISLIGTRGITGIECSSPYAKEDSETRDEAEELCYAPSLGAKILAVVTSKLPGGARGCDCIFHLSAILFEVTATRILQALAVRLARTTCACRHSTFLHLIFIATAALQHHRNEEEGENCEEHLVQHFSWQMGAENVATLCQQKLSLQSCVNKDCGIINAELCQTIILGFEP